MHPDDKRGQWTDFSDAGGIDKEYAKDRQRAQRELAAMEAGPKSTGAEGADTKDPDGDLLAPAASTTVISREGANLHPGDPEGQQGAIKTGAQDNHDAPHDNPLGEQNAPILHPSSLREDEQFAAIRAKQDEMRRADPTSGDSGETDPAVNAKPRY